MTELVKPIFKNQFVQTPLIVTQALLRHETFEGNILEPCCGEGAISELLKKTHFVYYSDLNKYNYECPQVDLFSINETFDNVITNPPFIQQQAVKKKLLSITKKKLTLLWYVKNLGNEVETKTSENLKAVYVFNQRIPWKETKLGWKFAWYVWDKQYKGDIIVKRIDL